jgi:hypothetical protein
MKSLLVLVFVIGSALANVQKQFEAGVALFNQKKYANCPSHPFTSPPP